MLSVEVHDDPDRVLLVCGVGVRDAHDLLELRQRRQVGLAVRRVVGAVRQADVMALEVREVAALARVVADARLPSPACHDRALRAISLLTPESLYAFPFRFPFPGAGLSCEMCCFSWATCRCKSGYFPMQKRLK